MPVFQELLEKAAATRFPVPRGPLRVSPLRTDSLKPSALPVGPNQDTMFQIVNNS